MRFKSRRKDYIDVSMFEFQMNRCCGAEDTWRPRANLRLLSLERVFTVVARGGNRINRIMFMLCEKLEGK